MFSVEVVGSKFIHGLASVTRKMFEVTYLIVWYVGSMDKIPALDLFGTTTEAVYPIKIIILFLISIILLFARSTD